MSGLRSRPIDPRLPDALPPGKQKKVRVPGRLTAREHQVVWLASYGLSNSEIGERLHLSTNTVKTHLYHAMAATSARDRTHLVALALRAGWME